ncbi:MAG: hypothetical protein R6X13_10910 [bacterium]
MSLLSVIILLPGLFVPPGGTFTACRTTPDGASLYDIGPGRFDDTVINLQGRWGVTVNLGNFDTDPQPEFVCRLSAPAPQNLNITKLVVLDHDLTVMWQDSWGESGNPEMVSTTIADIDGDGRDDIILPMAETHFATAPLYKARIYALDGATGAVKPGWPFILPGWPEYPYHKPHSEVAVADIDADDTLEIIVQVDDLGSIRKPGAGVYVLKPNGDSLWKFLFYTDTLDRHGAYTSPAVADLDGDGTEEIICHVGWFQRAYPYPVIEKRLFILNHDGTVRRQWQTQGAGATYSPDYASPAVGNIDGDPAPEILVVRRHGWLDCYDTLGTMRPGFPVDLNADARYHPPSSAVTRAFSTPAIADLNCDLSPEIILGTSGRETCNTRWAGRVHAFNADGSPYRGYPVATRNAIWYSPAVGNINSTASLEVLTAGCDSTFYVLDAQGASVPGWPVRDFPTYWLPDQGSYAFLEGIIPLSRTPFLADIDADNLVEILMEGSDGTLHEWDTDAAFDPSRLPCPTFRFNRERTGVYLPVQSALDEPRRPAHNPAAPAATVMRPGAMRLQMPVGTNQYRVVVRDCAGRVMRELDCTPCPDGSIELDLSGLPAGVAFVHTPGLPQALRVVLVD